jgi:hypothetical protein
MSYRRNSDGKKARGRNVDAIKIKAKGFPDLFEQVAAIARTAIPKPITFDTCETKEDAQARVIAHAQELTVQDSCPDCGAGVHTGETGNIVCASPARHQ